MDNLLPVEDNLLTPPDHTIRVEIGFNPNADCRPKEQEAFIPAHNNLTDIQGGTTTQRYHVTKIIYDALVAASNPSSSNRYITLTDIQALQDIIDDETIDLITTWSSEKIVNYFVAKIPGKGLSTEDYSTVEKDKLSNIAPYATANANDAYLLARENHTGFQEPTTINENQDKRFVSDVEKVAWNDKLTKAQADTYYKNINYVPAWTEITGKPAFFSGNYDDLINKPVIPTNTQMNNWDTAYSWGNPAGVYAPISHTHTFASITAKPTTLVGYGITDAQPFIVLGNSSQYWRGDKSWQTLNTDAVPESGNLYYTDTRVTANASVAANTAARHNAVTLGTANGLALAGQQLSLGLASTSSTGALSSTDWNTFNNKLSSASLANYVLKAGDTMSGALTTPTLNASNEVVISSTNVGINPNSGVTFYRTPDQTTNYEKARIYWSSQSFIISTEGLGTGVQRAINFIATNAVFSSNVILSNTPATSTPGAYNILVRNNGSGAVESISGTGFVLKTGDTMTGQLNIQQGSGFSLLSGADLNASTLTNATSKVSRMASPHYLTAQLPMATLMSESNSISNILRYGGGTSLANATTSHQWFTSGNNTTPSGTQMMTLTNAGLGIGTTAIAGKLNIEDETANDPFIFYKYHDSQALAGGMFTSKARGTIASPQRVMTNDRLFSLIGRGYNGGAWNAYSAGVFAYAAEDYTATTNNGSYIAFETTQSGTGSRTEKMRVNDSGIINIAISPPAPAGTFNILARSTQSGSVGNIVIPASTGTGSVMLNGSPTIVQSAAITGAAGTSRSFNYLTASTLRWSHGLNSAAETGSNNGSDFIISRYNDAGAFIDSPIGINRSTGLISTGQMLVQATADTNRGLLVRGFSPTQSTTLLEVQTSAAGFLVGIGPTGKMGLGVSVPTTTNVSVRLPITGGSISYGVSVDGIVQSDVTNVAIMYNSLPSISATTTLPALRNYYTNGATITAGGSLASQTGFHVGSGFNQATSTNYGFLSEVAAGTGRYGFNALGTADNSFTGAVYAGATVGGAQLNVKPTTDGLKGIQIRGNSATQSGNLLELQNSTGAAVTSITPAGIITTSGAITANGIVTSNGGSIIVNGATGAFSDIHLAEAGINRMTIRRSTDQSLQIIRRDATGTATGTMAVFNNATGYTSLTGDLANGSVGVTQATSDNSTKIATTAFVKSAMASAGVTPTFDQVITAGSSTNQSVGVGNLTAIGSVNASGGLFTNGLAVGVNWNTASNSLTPRSYVDARYIAGIKSITADGMTTTYTFAHGLGVNPACVLVTRGQSTDFSVFKTTWTTTDVTITYELAPAAGAIDLNWVAFR